MLGTANYFIGNDPKKWYSNVPTYAKVKYTGVYPGVDLIFYGNQQHLEYDFVVAPRADTTAIRLHFAGIRKLKLNKKGDLEVIAKNGEITFHKPVVYKMDHGQRRPVAGRFTLLANNSVGFMFRSYDHNSELIIDPTLEYSTYLGGSGYDYGASIAVDAAGDAYVTGQTSSTDFPVTSGAFQKVNNAAAKGGYNAFITKLNPAGTGLVYSTYLGGSGQDYGEGITVDSAGNAYVTGQTYSTDFPVTSDAFQRANHSTNGGNAFVAKLNPAGTALVYSTYLGGDGNSEGSGDNGHGIAVDTSGDAYVTGAASSTDFPVTSGAFQKVNNAAANEGSNTFITKLNLAGTALIYSTYLGGSRGDGGIGIAVDTSGDAYVTGASSSTDFPVTSGAFQKANNATAKFPYNAFITKLNPAGTALIYSTYLGGSDEDYGIGIAGDTAGNAHVTGIAFSTDFPVTPGAFQKVNHTAAQNGFNAFITKLDPAGTALIYSTYLGGSSLDDGASIAVDTTGNAYVTGITFSTDFPVTPGAFQVKNNGNRAFITKLNPVGTRHSSTRLTWGAAAATMATALPWTLRETPT